MADAKNPVCPSQCRDRQARCVFCERNADTDPPYCSHCKEYKGVYLACPDCGWAYDASGDWRIPGYDLPPDELAQADGGTP